MLAHILNIDLDGSNATCGCVDPIPTPSSICRSDFWHKVPAGWTCPPREENACHKSESSSLRGSPVTAAYELGAIAAVNASTKVAWCLSGNLRTFASDSVQRGFKAVWSIMGETTWGRPDLFLYGTLMNGEVVSTPWAMHQPTVRNMKEVVADLGFRRAIIKTSPGEATVENIDCFIGHRQECFNNGWLLTMSPAAPVNMVNQWIHLSQCFDLVKDSEAERSAKYEIVILSRPDLWFHSSWNETDELAQALHRASLGEVTNGADFLFILPRNLAAKMSTVRDVFRTCRKGQRCCGVQKSEDFAAYLLNVESGMPGNEGSACECMQEPVRHENFWHAKPDTYPQRHQDPALQIARWPSQRHGYEMFNLSLPASRLSSSQTSHMAAESRWHLITTNSTPASAAPAQL
eukprot:gnl/TRDRNA2_/TRDRNA2_168835_c1_seq6.p1 gnl/TRDRNA2_/TRDRNA2_168835_c1~~gnl/TRDRNA2_/TRDRNA2_168835_c1_seq6.p1  ORF type:complete len:431 (-),score=36.10 gnl/TRDRNA2_/TRDRNA2_168835_c1_seq6:454-1668(-)